MSETVNTILIRRSTGKFLNKPIPDGDLQRVIQTVLYAPSGMGRWTWQFTMVKNREKIQELTSVIRTTLSREGYDIYQPEVLVIPSNDRESPFEREDSACAMGNIFLVVHSMGTGSVWINQLQGVCDDPVIRQVLLSPGIPQSHVAYGVTTLGYADDEKTKKERISRVVIVE